ncbi:hypothetical protein EV193_10364 [Herbihabitans rhizosphaerae]|uniref:Uncharacterized protein n=1 Tax=Herbihabitans rhizosphaerae TaxID=1872711 RepID=A0A4Q7KXM2_9PSEU|nr:hypothetical protein [Herbihabitans rhizosphaerae]RZS40751.1 hypothetical protein EV193_10364 [Herbihabitans rhizosphaerae]
MGAGDELRKAVRHRIFSLFADIEHIVHRHGYLRVLTGTITMLGLVGILGQVLGLTWLRWIFATSAGVLFLVASAVSFAGTERLRARIAQSETLLHGAARALDSKSPISIREWRQVVTLESNGDAKIWTEMVLDEAQDGIPHFLFVNQIYYGGPPLTDRQKRLVECEVFHANSDTSGVGVRAQASSSWSASKFGEPKLDVFAHLGNTVHQGDKVTVKWLWPKYSADLMTGHRPENFDVKFYDQSISMFEYTVIFRDVDSDNEFTMRNLGANNLVQTRSGRDIAVSFSGDHPEAGKSMGFVADLTGRAQK